MKTDPLFIRITAICAFLTSLTTTLLWLLPKLYAAPTSFEEGVALAANSMYMARLWVNLLHIPLALTAYFGMAYILRKRELPKVGLGMVFFGIWGIVEMIGVSGIIFAVNGNWRTDYTTATVAEKVILKANIESYLSLWDSMFFVLLIGFLLATIFFGWATWNGKGLEKLLSYLFWLAAPLTFLIILSGYFNEVWAGWVVAWMYPLLQPISRFLMGMVIWKKA
nr:hypothetical protein [Allomuricauda sp.]